MSRPTKYTPQLARAICEQIATTTLSIHNIANDLHISPSMIMRWLNKHQSFREQYARARELQADLLASQILEIADNARMEKKTTIKPTGTETVEADMVSRSRLMVDVRKWLASKLAPKKFGDQIDLTTQGEKINAKPCILNWEKPSK